MKKLQASIASLLLASIFPVATTTPLAVNGRTLHDRTEQEKERPAKAVVTYKPEPKCPRKARDLQIEATILLKAVFRSSGEVTDIEFARVIPEKLHEEIVNQLTEESIKAARQIKFKPAMKDGHPVSMYMLLQYNFDCR